MPMSYENVDVTAVQLAYVVTYLWPEMDEMEMSMERPSPTIYLQTSLGNSLAPLILVKL